MGFPQASGHSHLSQHGVLHGLHVDIYSTISLHGLQGDNLPRHGLHHSLQENLSSGTRSTFSASFFTDLGVCWVVPLPFSRFSLPATTLFHPFLNTLS